MLSDTGRQRRERVKFKTKVKMSPSKHTSIFHSAIPWVQDHKCGECHSCKMASCDKTYLLMIHDLKFKALIFNQYTTGLEKSPWTSGYILTAQVTPMDNSPGKSFSNKIINKTSK